jgi:hypothetical protein
MSTKGIAASSGGPTDTELETLEVPVVTSGEQADDTPTRQAAARLDDLQWPTQEGNTRPEECTTQGSGGLSARSLKPAQPDRARPAWTPANAERFSALQTTWL